MRNTIALLVLTVLSTNSYANDTELIEEKINKVNKLSVETLGVSLTALTYLVKASPDSFLTVEYMDKEDISAIAELEAAGYVTTEKVQGLPDGTHKEMHYLRVIPNHSGYEAQRCLLALEHNNSLKAGTAKNAAP